MMGKWSDDSACRVVNDDQLYSVLGTVVLSGEDVCCSVLFGTLVGVFVFSRMWPELLMASAICYPLWSSVYEHKRVGCVFTSPVTTECGMFVMYCMQWCISVICLGLLMCTLTIWSYVLCVLIVEGMYGVVNVMLSLLSVIGSPLPCVTYG